MELFSLDLIKLKYYALDKKSCLTEMSEFLFEKGIISSFDDFFRAVMERENLMSTGIGRSVAIPHARSNAVLELKILVYLLDNELPFNAIDGEPVRIVFMIAVPETMKQEYTKALSLISNFLRNEQNRNELLNSITNEEALKILKRIKYET